MNTQLAELAKNFDVSLRGALSALAFKMSNSLCFAQNRGCLSLFFFTIL